MKQLQTIILLILTLIQNVNSQDKVFKGDTAFWYNQNQELNNTLELTDFSTSQNDFSFRFRNQGQVVEISKINNQIHGELTNYIFHSIKKRSEILHEKIQLDSVKALEIYEIIQKSGILDLQSDNKIDGWSGGYDGINYIIEHSDKKEYWYKTYWTPSAQDSIPESLIVMDFVKALNDTLQLSEKYKEFKEDIPQKGCYNSGGISQTCYTSKYSFGLGYCWSSKLPIGLSSSVYLINRSKTYSYLGVGFQYKFDRNDNYDFGFNASISSLLIKNSKTKDYLFYNYQKRKLDFLDTNTVFQNHLFNYGLIIKNKTHLYTAVNYAINYTELIGGNFGVYRWFNKPKISTTLSTSIFKDNIDYKIGISKLFLCKNRIFVKSTSIGLNFENFKDYNDLNIYLTLSL